mmetsp:Transcript_23643/g.41967  ORF Transcript_23643/g.41967 Transcript_23643/m.41967 type:complete len:205 (+) Transcript_23643:1324-1938(+)
MGGVIDDGAKDGHEKGSQESGNDGNIGYESRGSHSMGGSSLFIGTLVGFGINATDFVACQVNQRAGQKYVGHDDATAACSTKERLSERKRREEKGRVDATLGWFLRKWASHKLTGKRGQCYSPNPKTLYPLAMSTSSKQQQEQNPQHLFFDAFSLVSCVSSVWSKAAAVASFAIGGAPLAMGSIMVVMSSADDRQRMRFCLPRG